MCLFCVSTLPLVKGDCEILGRKIIPNSYVQFTNSVLIKAVPRLCTIDWGIPNEWILFSTAGIVVWAPVLATGYTIKKQENASMINRQWRFRWLGGWRGPLWSMWIARNGVVSFCHFSNGTSFLCFDVGLFFLHVRQSAVSAYNQSNIPRQ